MSMSALHASLSRGETPQWDARTGEIRIQLALYDLDELQARPDLVLSRGEAESLFAHLRAVLAPVPEPTRHPELVR